MSRRDIAVCIGCGCDDFHACPGGCYWLRVDYADRKGVCSDCPEHVEAWDAGDRTAHSQLIAEIEAEMAEMAEDPEDVHDEQLQRRTPRPESPKPDATPCPHDWPYEITEMGDCCRWCGITFTHYVFTECP